MNSEVKVVSIIVILTILVIIGGLSLTSGKSNSNSTQNDIKIDPAFLTSSTSPRQGPENSKVQIVEFADFACPACGMLAPNLKAALADYKDSVSYSMRIIPIHNKTSLDSAVAAFAAGEQGKFFEMGDILFAKQSEWVAKHTPDLFIKYATELGLDIPKFTATINSKEFIDKVTAQITKDNQDATSMQISSTPTVIVNGKIVIIGVQTTETLKKIVKDELAK